MTRSRQSWTGAPIPPRSRSHLRWNASGTTWPISIAIRLPGRSWLSRLPTNFTTYAASSPTTASSAIDCGTGSTSIHRGQLRYYRALADIYRRRLGGPLAEELVRLTFDLAESVAPNGELRWAQIGFFADCAFAGLGDPGAIPVRAGGCSGSARMGSAWCWGPPKPTGFLSKSAWPVLRPWRHVWSS